MKVCACAAAGLVCVFLHQGGNFINFMFELLLHWLSLSVVCHFIDATFSVLFIFAFTFSVVSQNIFTISFQCV